MIHSVEGVLEGKGPVYAVVSAGGIGYKVYVSARTLSHLPKPGSPLKLFTFLSVKEDALDLFGFLDEPSLRLFEILCTVNGVGPRTALAVTDVDSVERVTAAILEKRADLILRAPGIGKKTAERIILELHSKLESDHAPAITGRMTEEADVEEALASLGYPRHEAREAARESTAGEGGFEEALRRALRFLGSKKQQ